MDLLEKQGRRIHVFLGSESLVSQIVVNYYPFLALVFLHGGIIGFNSIYPKKLYDFEQAQKPPFMTQEQDKNLHWYAFKVFYNKVFEIDKGFRATRVETYFPVVKSYKLVDDKQKLEVKPAISSLIFVHCTVDQVVALQQDFYGRVLLYTHVTDGIRRPSPIDEEEMRIFKLVTSVEDERLQYLDVGSINYKEGQRVKVLDGPYQGCEGYIKRIKGNRRLLVAVEGLALVATSYIPSEFLEKV